MDIANPEVLFQLVSSLALLGWIWLLLALFFPQKVFARTNKIGLIIPLVLSLFYTSAILTFFNDADGGFNSLRSVMRLFDSAGATLAGWIHFLAFDLLVGWWIVQDVRKHKLNRLLILPILFFTFYFGPMGLLLYFGYRAAWAIVTKTIDERAV